jgi:hypothetical protein
LTSGSSDFVGEDGRADRGDGDGGQAVEQEDGGDDNHGNVPEPEGQKDLLIDDVLQRKKETYLQVKFSWMKRL